MCEKEATLIDCESSELLAALKLDVTEKSGGINQLGEPLRAGRET